VREEPDVRHVLQVLTRYEHLYNEALHIHLAETDATATIRIRLDLPESRRRQSIELGSCRGAVGSPTAHRAGCSPSQWRRPA
jgi:hypothetical protein